MQNNTKMKSKVSPGRKKYQHKIPKHLKTVLVLLALVGDVPDISPDDLDVIVHTVTFSKNLSRVLLRSHKKRLRDYCKKNNIEVWFDEKRRRKDAA